jgi:hypothetical protein
VNLLTKVVEFITFFFCHDVFSELRESESTVVSMLGSVR